MSGTDVPSDGGERDRPRHAELEELADDDLASVVAEAKADVWDAGDRVERGLNGERPLTDGDVSDLSDAVHELRAGVEAVTQRVPPEHRYGE